MKNSRSRWKCVDCRKDTSKMREHYFVTSEVWFNLAKMPERGMLCIGCLEDRIGRQLTSADFPIVHVNNPRLYEMSARLVNRITGR